MSVQRILLYAIPLWILAGLFALIQDGLRTSILTTGGRSR